MVNFVYQICYCNAYNNLNNSNDNKYLSLNKSRLKYSDYYRLLSITVIIVSHYLNIMEYYC